MSYLVNDEIPQYCNKCPFGILRYSTPLSTNKHGYNCNLDFKKNGRYTKQWKMILILILVNQIGVR